MSPLRNSVRTSVAALTLCCFAVGSLLVVDATPAMASHVSNFVTTDGDFSITGFSMPASPFPVPTNGPLTISMTGQVGTYDLDIPPAGTSWEVIVNGNTNLVSGITVLPLPLPPTSLGTFVSPGPGSLPSWSGSAIVPDFDYTSPLTFATTTISGVSMNFIMDVDNTAYPSGAYGPGASTQITLSGGNLFVINSDFTAIDNLGGGANGIFSGTNNGTLTVTLVPEPATLASVFCGLLAAVPVRRRLVS